MRKQFALSIKDKVQNLNVTKTVCNHLIGENHSNMHRLLTGVIIMSAGVFISKSGNGFVMHIIADVVGYAIHGIGLIPFVENLMKIYKGS